MGNEGRCYAPISQSAIPAEQTVVRSQTVEWSSICLAYIYRPLKIHIGQALH